MTDRNSLRISWLLLIMMTMLLNACSSFQLPPTLPAESSPISHQETQTPPASQVEIVFNLELAEGADAGEIYFEALDVLTGLQRSTARHPMTKLSDQSFSVKILANVGSVIKYRFSRGEKNPVPEATCSGNTILARSFLVVGQDISNNVVCAWEGTSFKGHTGRISSTITDAATEQPLGGVFVEAAGIRAISAADGRYLLEGLPPGTHTIFAYSLDGEYQPFQQGAVVAGQSNTPAPLQLSPSTMVEMTFRVMLPPSELPNLPVRLVGNTYKLGYTYAEESFESAAILASRAPLLEQQEDGSYAITVKLPEGFDLRYKYTLGDVFWNSELFDTGELKSRQLIVPSKNTTISEKVESWTSENTEPVVFKVSVPEITPAADSVSIQFNRENIWTEPLPMWPLGGQDWYFILYNPIDQARPITYRYCRNEQCGVADDTRTAGMKATGLIFSESQTTQVIEDQISAWSAYQNLGAVEEEATASKIRSGLFVSGVEFQPHYQPSWQPHMATAMQDIRSLGAGWVVLTPGWNYLSNNPPVLQPLPGQTPLRPEQAAIVQHARDANLHVAVYPQMLFDIDPLTWWKNARRDSDWWQRWFEQYRNLVLHYAIWSQQMGSEMLIIGGPDILPATPGFKFADGSTADLPADAPERWRGLIADLRDAFDGQILWAVPYPGKLTQAPEWVDAVDQIYLLWSAPLADDDTAKPKAVTARMTKLLKEDVLPLKDRFNKPILLGVSYPSLNGAITGCVKIDGACMDFMHFDHPTLLDDPDAFDFNEQSDAYRAMLKVISRDEFRWVSGLISRGYYPPAKLTDGSNSIHGKPVEKVLSFWFNRLRQSE